MTAPGHTTTDHQSSELPNRLCNLPSEIRVRILSLALLRDDTIFRWHNIRHSRTRVIRAGEDYNKYRWIVDKDFTAQFHPPVTRACRQLFADSQYLLQRKSLGITLLCGTPDENGYTNVLGHKSVSTFLRKLSPMSLQRIRSVILQIHFHNGVNEPPSASKTVDKTEFLEMACESLKLIPRLEYLDIDVRSHLAGSDYFVQLPIPLLLIRTPRVNISGIQEPMRTYLKMVITSNEPVLNLRAIHRDILRIVDEYCSPKDWQPLIHPDQYERGFPEDKENCSKTIPGKSTPPQDENEGEDEDEDEDDSDSGACGKFTPFIDSPRDRHMAVSLVPRSTTWIPELLFRHWYNLKYLYDYLDARVKWWAQTDEHIEWLEAGQSRCLEIMDTIEDLFLSNSAAHCTNREGYVTGMQHIRRTWEISDSFPHSGVSKRLARSKNEDAYMEDTFN